MAAPRPDYDASRCKGTEARRAKKSGCRQAGMTYNIITTTAQPQLRLPSLAAPCLSSGYTRPHKHHRQIVCLFLRFTTALQVIPCMLRQGRPNPAVAHIAFL